MTTHDHMKAAWSAIMAGDLAERDRQCELAKQSLEDEKYAGVKRLMEVDFFVTPDGRVIPIQMMLAKA